MRKTVAKAGVLGLFFVIMVVMLGCEEQQQLSPKQKRLVAYENQQLEKRLVKLQREHNRQKELLAKCRQKKQSGESESLKNTQKMLVSIFDENVRLKKENEQLKAQIEQFLEQLEKSPKPL